VREPGIEHRAIRHHDVGIVHEHDDRTQHVEFRVRDRGVSQGLEQTRAHRRVVVQENDVGGVERSSGLDAGVVTDDGSAILRDPHDTTPRELRLNSRGRSVGRSVVHQNGRHERPEGRLQTCQAFSSVGQPVVAQDDDDEMLGYGHAISPRQRRHPARAGRPSHRSQTTRRSRGNPIRRTARNTECRHRAGNRSPSPEPPRG